MTIADALIALAAELAEGGVPLPLSQRFTLAATAADLCRIAGEPVPALVLAALDGPEHAPSPAPGFDAAFAARLLAAEAHRGYIAG